MLDSLMASHINAEAVSAVAYLSQINITVSSIGMGLAIGSSLKISEAYGAGNYELVGRRVGNRNQQYCIQQRAECEQIPHSATYQLIVTRSVCLTSFQAASNSQSHSNG